MNLGACSITRAEICEALLGLEFAWDKGYRKICLKLDSQAAIALLTSTGNTEHQHTYREGNFATDYLASLGYNVGFGSHLVNTLDGGLCYFLRYDCIGVAEPRSILIND
ncbi:Putative ribonuclease H protein At1g65750 [Linum perenne]